MNAREKAMERYENETERFEHDGMTVVLCSDPDAPSPRDSDGNLATIAHWHRHANVGDRRIEPVGLLSLVRKLKAEGDEVLAILPVWIYQHGSIALRAAPSRPGYPFNCQWDAGQVGWAYVTRRQAEAAGCKPGETHSYKDSAGEHVVTYDKAFFQKAIADEVELFDLWANGGFSGYMVVDKHGDVVDSCWGFDDRAYCRRQATEAAVGMAAREKKARKEFPRAAWKRAVASGATELGYEDWLRAQRAQKGRAA